MDDPRPEERAFIERLRDGFSSPELSPREVEQFDAAIFDRVKRSRRRKVGLAMMVPLFAAMMLFAVYSPSTEKRNGTVAEKLNEIDWLSPLIDPDALDGRGELEDLAPESPELKDQALLPPEYAVLAALLQLPQEE